jgi:hypothetical protein
MLLHIDLAAFNVPAGMALVAVSLKFQQGEVVCKALQQAN